MKQVEYPGPLAIEILINIMLMAYFQFETNKPDQKHMPCPALSEVLFF